VVTPRGFWFNHMGWIRERLRRRVRIPPRQSRRLRSSWQRHGGFGLIIWDESVSGCAYGFGPVCSFTQFLGCWFESIAAQ